MSVTIMKNKGETIVDNTPKEPFVSPLQRYIRDNCKQCAFYTGKCRLDDQNGISRMSLCITLSGHETPDFLKNMIQSGTLPTSSPDDDIVAEAELGDL
jgi:hypothetical protein